MKAYYMGQRYTPVKLGKKPVKKDDRNIQLKSILKKVLPPIPDKFDLDQSYQPAYQIPTPMFGNDQWGCCVIAGRAHQTLRFEVFEQSQVLPITTDEVLKQYWKEGKANCFNPRPDRGLVMLYSLRDWRSNGWAVGMHKYNIYAFAQVHPTDMGECKAGIYLLNGLNIGLNLPVSAQNQSVWDVTSGPGAEAGSWGGHCVYVPSYDTQGLTCVTWGYKQKMTWSFFWRYCDEAYAIVDNKNAFTPNSPVDIDKLNGYLKDIDN